MARRGTAGLAAAALTLTLGGAARGEPAAPPGLDVERHRARPERLGVAELGLGWLVLPGADVCAERGAGDCSEGDTSPILRIAPLYRASPLFDVGAGITLGLIPTTDAPRQDPPGITRDHSRRYLMVEALARYYPYLGESFEAWVGPSGGLVVVGDTYATSSGSDDKALVGPRGVTIRTEGYALGLAAGLTYRLDAHWTLGGDLRYGGWFLPSEPASDPLGDEASLSGRNAVLSATVNVGYRVPL
ncbi:MAG: hypothetical protein OZ921_12360 [Sorangiineae bacterium]|nr:hypothetical protein [Polyangiaceae bacterium]MEB2323299.1 hypothetical protein [Sorangiineae bacterium]